MRRSIIFLIAALLTPACAASSDTESEVVDSQGLGNEMDKEVLERIQGASQVVALLVASGEILSEERPIELFFYGDQEKIGALASSELLSGYDLRMVDEPSGVIAASTAVIDDEWIVRTAYEMVMAARKFGVEYDGWETELVRQGQ